MKENDLEFDSLFEAGQNSGNNESLIKLIVAILIVGGVAFWIFNDIQPIQEGFTLTNEAYLLEEKKAALSKQAESELVEVIEEVVIEEEEQTVEFYYKRALQREGDKDYKGAVEDYTKTIGLAKKYSSEMWNALNNGGIIKAQQFKDYKNAIKDFNKIISIESNRYNGEINATRLESGYTNRA